MYRLVAYKSDSVDTCRGQVMERFSSDFVKEEFETSDQLVERLAKLLYHNAHHEIGDSSYDESDIEVTATMDENEESFSVLTDKYMPLAEARAVEIWNEKVAKDTEQKLETERRQAATQTQRELTLLANLKEKYEK